MHNLQTYQKINGSCDLVGTDAIGENSVDQLLRVVSPDASYLQLDDQTLHSIKPTIERKLQFNNPAIKHLQERCPLSKSMDVDVAPSECKARASNSLQPSTWTSSSFTEMEAANILLALPQGGTRPIIAAPLPKSSEATPKASGFNPTNIGPCKSHKRSHSKVNDALQKEVRKQLQSVAAETMEAYGDGLEHPDNVKSKNPIHKETQLPYRSWASVKKPILQGTEYNKRYCATQHNLEAADRAAMYLRRSFKSDSAPMYSLAFAGHGAEMVSSPEIFV
jgi:hypothetical protein